MPCSSFAMIMALIVFHLFILHASAQSVPGAAYLQGGGAPGSGVYKLVDDYNAANFFNKFNFYSGYDPTYGHVQYINASVAFQNQLAFATNNETVILKPDTANKFPPGGPGRPSVRITSDNTYLHGLFLLDLKHMPWGCGTWPAYWLLGPNWPYTGEIDIIEGVNTGTSNTMSLHSSQNCTITGSGQTATFQSTDCDATSGNYNGCGSTIDNTHAPLNAYGNGLNNIGGGVYATEWTSSYIKHWWFPRGSIPTSVDEGRPDLSTFGTPLVNAQGGCDIDTHFQNMSVIMNIDFCGAWAGQVYYSQFPSCPQTANAATDSLGSCVEFVGNNPDQMANAYFEINYLRVYQMPNAVATTSTYSTSLSSVMPSSNLNTVKVGMGATLTSGSSSAYTGPLTTKTASSTSDVPWSSATPALCPLYNNTIWTDYNNQQYSILCGSDYSGGSAGVFGTTSFEQCLELCDNTNGCYAVAFVGGNGIGNCYPKPLFGYPVQTAAVNVAIRIAGPASVTSSAFMSSGVPSQSISSPASANMPTSSRSSSPRSSLASVSSGPWNSVPGSVQPLTSLASDKSSLSGSDSIPVPYITTTSTSKIIASTTSTNSAQHSWTSTYSTTIVSSLFPSTTDSSTSSFSIARGTLYGTPAPSCPTSSTSLCESSRTGQSTCTFNDGTQYSVSCGIEYSGIAISVQSYGDLAPASKRDASGLAEPIRATVGRDEPSVQDCQQLCEYTSNCVAVNYVGTNCTLLSAVTGSSPNPSAIGAAPVSPTSPTCPGSANRTYADTKGVPYSIDCYSDYFGNDIGTPIDQPSLMDCLPYCDSMLQCFGVEYLNGLCYLKSSFRGNKSSNAGVILAVRDVVVASTSAYGPTVTATPSLTTTLVLSGGTVTIEPVSTVTVTVGGGVSDGLSVGMTGISTNLSSSTSACLCYTCALTPTVIPDCSVPTNPDGSNHDGSGPITTNVGINGFSITGRSSSSSNNGGAGFLTSIRGTCGANVVSGTGTTTVVTTYTITSCGMPAICPASGYIIGSNLTQSGGQAIVTTDRNGDVSTYTQFPTSRSTVTSAGQDSVASISPSRSSTTQSGSTAAPICPYSQNELYNDAYGNQYTIYCDTIFTDLTIQEETKVSLAECVAACDMYNILTFFTASQCLGISYNSGQSTQNCLLKSGSTGVPLIGTHSAKLLTRQSGPGNNTTPGSMVPIGSMSSASVSITFNPPMLYDITHTLVSVSYFPASTVTQTTTQPGVTGPTVTTTQPGVSVTLTQTQTLSGPTITATQGSVTVTQTIGSGGPTQTEIITLTISARTVTTTVFLRPTSSSSAFTCRTYATNFLNGLHGKRSSNGERRRGVFQQGLEMKPMPGARLVA